MPLYDDDDNVVEGALTPDEAKELQEKAAKADELQKSIEEKEKELAKFRNKDINFTELRHKTEEEKAAIMEKASEKEKLVLKELMDLRKEREDEKKARFEAARESLLKGLAGDDDELKKSIELRAKQWGEPKTPEELEQRYNDAFTLIKSTKPSVSPLREYYPASSYQGEQKPKKFTETEQGKQSVKTWFPDLAKKIYKEEQK